MVFHFIARWKQIGKCAHEAVKVAIDHLCTNDLWSSGEVIIEEGPALTHLKSDWLIPMKNDSEIWMHAGQLKCV
jgi:hypothetical protein